MESEGNIQGAIASLYDVDMKFADPQISDLKEELEDKLPVKLVDMEPLNEEFSYMVYALMWLDVSDSSTPYKCCNKYVKDNTGKMHSNEILFGMDKNSDCVSETGGDNSIAISYFINQKYDLFSAEFGLTEEYKTSKIKGYLIIYGDDRLLYESPKPVSSGILPVSISIDVKDISILKIVYFSEKADKIDRELFALYDPILLKINEK